MKSRGALGWLLPIVWAAEPLAHAEPPLDMGRPPVVRLTVTAPTTRGPWRMQVKNEGDGPVRIVADARLLALDVSPRSARSATHCELPADMRPDGDLGRGLVLPVGGSYSEAFEPRLYCLGADKLNALAPGAVVVARLGWPAARGSAKTEGPFEVTPVDGAAPVVAPWRGIDSPPVALPDEPSAWGTASPETPDARPLDAPRLVIEGARSVDAEMPNDITLPVTLRNDGSRAVVVRFRPEALRFDLIGPAGVENCKWPVMPAAAVREVFTTIAPKGSEELTVTLSSYCVDHGLDQPGLLVVRPRLDTRSSAGASVGLHAFEGEVIALTPTLVRLHRGAASVASPPPRLDP
jgi:hypothetical protein